MIDCMCKLQLLKNILLLLDRYMSVKHFLNDLKPNEPFNHDNISVHTKIRSLTFQQPSLFFLIVKGKNLTKGTHFYNFLSKLACPVPKCIYFSNKTNLTHATTNLLLEALLTIILNILDLD